MIETKFLNDERFIDFSLSQKVHFLEVCYQIAKITYSDKPLQETLNEICSLAVEVTGAERGSIMMAFRGKELNIIASRNVPLKAAQNARIEIGDETKISGWVSKYREPLLIENIMEDKRFAQSIGKSKRASDGYQTTSLISVPLKIQRQFIGVFNVTNKADKSVFTPYDLRVITHLADELSSFIYHLKTIERAKRHAMKAEATYKQLLEADTMKKDLTRMIIHDLKAPLSEIEQSLVLYLGETENNGKGDLNLVKTSISGCKTLKELINDVLDIDRVQSGFCNLFCEEFNVLDIVEEAISGLHLMLAEKNIAYEVKCKDEQLEWIADVDFLQRILMNLLTNVYKYASDGKRVIVAFGKNEEGLLEFSVEDFGKGVPKGEEDRIFDRFALFVTEGGKQGRISSSGLGLAFCKLAVEAHGGKISVRNKPGKGCVFTFTLKKQEITVSAEH